MPARLKTPPDEPEYPAGFFAAHLAYFVIWFTGFTVGFVFIVGWSYWLALLLPLLAVCNAYSLPTDGMILVIKRWNAPLSTGVALATADLAIVGGLIVIFYFGYVVQLPSSLDLFAFVVLVLVLILILLPGFSFSCFWLKHLSRQAERSAAAAEQGLCTNCGYDLRGLASEMPCPECGTTREPPHEPPPEPPFAST